MVRELSFSLGHTTAFALLEYPTRMPLDLAHLMSGLKSLKLLKLVTLPVLNPLRKLLGGKGWAFTFLAFTVFPPFLVRTDFLATTGLAFTCLTAFPGAVLVSVRLESRFLMCVANTLRLILLLGRLLPNLSLSFAREALFIFLKRVRTVLGKAFKLGFAGFRLKVL